MNTTVRRWVLIVLLGAALGVFVGNYVAEPAAEETRTRGIVTQTYEAFRAEMDSNLTFRDTAGALGAGADTGQGISFTWVNGPYRFTAFYRYGNDQHRPPSLFIRAVPSGCEAATFALEELGQPDYQEEGMIAWRRGDDWWFFICFSETGWSVIGVMDDLQYRIIRGEVKQSSTH